MNNIKNIFSFLSIHQDITLIGSSANKQLKYVTDYDTQEQLFNIDPYFIWVKFQDKFRIAKHTEHIYITDLKAGVYNTIPVRWNYKQIMKGYQDIDDKRIRFIDCLHNDSGNVVKLDLIVFYDNMFHEFSCNYYFGETEIPDEQLYNSLLVDVEKYYFDLKYMKMLKRFYSYLNKTKPKQTKKYISFFNSKAGLFNQLQHQTNIIIDVMENSFRKVKNKQIMLAINELKNKMPRPYKSYVKKSKLKELSNLLHIKVNNEVIKFSEKF